MSPAVSRRKLQCQGRSSVARPWLQLFRTASAPVEVSAMVAGAAAAVQFYPGIQRKLASHGRTDRRTHALYCKSEFI
jgi:hypothetical protein